MAIFRGTGSTGTGGESDFAQLAQDAEAAAAAAEIAQLAAELAENNAETAETNAETAATNASSSASAASTSASAASTSATNAASSASTATTQASNAATSATNAANSATAASNSASAASTSATNAASSATSAAGSATTATTQATNAASSATAAATSASSASTSATNASNSASAASTSATNASNSATAANNSATSAATSATNAASSATAAASSAAEAAATVTSKVSKSGDTMTGPLIVNANTSTDAFRITQIGAGNALVVEDSANPDATPFVVNGSGVVLVGVNAQRTVGNLAQFEIEGVDANTSSASITRNTANAGAGYLAFGKSRGSTTGAFDVVSSGDQLGNIQFYGADGTSLVPAALIQAGVDGTPGTNDMPGRLVFSTTADGASSPTEAMRIDSGQRVGIGGAPAAGRTFSIAKNITGSVNSWAVSNAGTVQSDVTSNAYYFRTSTSTAASAFTLGGLIHFEANQGTIGAGSTVTNQYGFSVQSNLTGATNNYGFYSNIASGTGRYNFYAAGSAANFMAGPLYLGQNYYGNVGLGVYYTSGATTGTGVYNDTQIGSATTSSYIANSSYIGTQAAAFTLNNLTHYQANQQTFGAGSTVTSQYGFSVTASLTGATNNYGFYSNIASGTGRYNFYAAGSAANYMAGRLGIGDTTDIGALLFVNGALTNSTSYGVKHQSAFSSGVTTGVHYSALTYVGASATIGSIKNFQADQSTIGSGATVNSQYAFIAENGLTGATNNYGFYSNIASGTGRYNFYAAGSADNYFAGAVGVGTSSLSSGYKVDILPPSTGTALRIRGGSGGSSIVQFTDNAESAQWGTLSTTSSSLDLAHSAIVRFSTNSTERMRLDSAGSVGIGGAPTAGYSVQIKKTITGAIGSAGLEQQGIVQSGVTSLAQGFSNISQTVAAAFTLSAYRHYDTYQGTIGAGSAITNQYGFFAHSTLTGATNNYGFYSNIASGTGRWNFYAAGTADNYFAGKVGVGTASPSAALHLYNASVVDFKLGNSTVTYNSYVDSVGYACGTFTAHPYIITTNNTERMRIDSNGIALIGLTSATGVAKLQVSGPIKTTGYTVATLPAGTVGMRTYVTDAMVPVALAIVAGGGSSVVPVFYNGTNWIVA